MAAPTPFTPRRGHSLLELMVGLGAAAALVATALPGLGTPGERVARADGVQALLKLRQAQEQHRSGQGQYASHLDALRLGELSVQKRYRLTLTTTAPDKYTATAVAVGAQARDSACPELTLQVDSGFATTGPDGRCWNR